MRAETRRKYLVHSVFWLLYYVVFVLIESGYDHRYGRVFASHGIELLVKLAFTYTLLLVLIPKLLYRGRSALFWTCSAGLLIGAAFLYRLCIGYIVVPYLFQDRTFVFFDLARFTGGAIDIAFPAAIVISMELIVTSYQREMREKLLHEEKTNMELNFLKSQMSPHFLFNTLNNIYGLAIDESPATAKVIIGLSELMRSILENTRRKTIRLQEEIGMIDHYIALERIRYDNKLSILFNKTIEDHDLEISPLILLTLVENAFKHGVSESVTDPEIIISLVVTSTELLFRVENSGNTSAVSGSGTGLQNLNRQLGLIYPNRHSFRFYHDSRRFVADLVIQSDVK